MPSLSNWVLKHSEIKRQPTFFFLQILQVLLLYMKDIYWQMAQNWENKGDSDYLQ